jgi:CRP-like cAMP-binding protein
LIAAAARKTGGISIPCTACPLRKLSRFREFTEEELAFVLDLKRGELSVERGAAIVMEKSASPHLYTVLSGWGFRYKTLPDGRRQILNYILPGDFIGLQTSVFEMMDHGIESLTDMLLCVFPRDRLLDVYRKCPSLGFDITWLAARQERLLDDNLLSVGRRTARERMAFIFLYFYRRAEEAGMVQGKKLRLPVTQQQLADTLGLSLVHTNRTLGKLRTTGCVRWGDGLLEIIDVERLIGIAGSDFATDHLRPFI